VLGPAGVVAGSQYDAAWKYLNIAEYYLKWIEI
jgi:hypothetical protein